MAPPATSLLVMRGEDVVFSRRQGAGPHSLFYTFSTGKPLLALAVHLLAQRGVVSLDDPICRHWPQYAQHGKDAVTIRHVLTHRAGVALSTSSIVGDLRLMHDWQASVDAAERARPRSEPGSTVFYHVLSFGFILGELIERVTGERLDVFLHREILTPVGMADTWVRLSEARARDALPLTSVGGLEWMRAALFNTPRVRRALIPAASVHSTAADQARFYRMLLRGGVTESGQQLVSPSTIDALTELSSDGEYDRGMLHTTRWGTGVQLGYPGMVRVFGTQANATTFGHNGSNVCLAWADPERDLVVVYLSTLIQKRLRARRMLCRLSDEAIRRYG